MNGALMLTAVLVLGAEGEVPPEMKVLEKFVGTWEMESFVQSAGNPEKKLWTRTEKAEVTLGGHYVEIKSYNDEGKLAGQNLFTYHAPTQKYRLWHFSSTGGAQDGIGEWDAETQTLTVTGDTDDGSVWEYSMHFIDDNNREGAFSAKDKDGEVFVKLRSKSTRQ